MGEIGIPSDTALSSLQLWQIHQIIDGYNRRYRHPWSMTRWSTFHIMAASVDMSKAGITSPSQLLPLPWDERQGPTDDEVAESVAELNAINAQLANDS